MENWTDKENGVGLSDEENGVRLSDKENRVGLSKEENGVRLTRMKSDCLTRMESDCLTRRMWYDYLTRRRESDYLTRRMESDYEENYSRTVHLPPQPVPHFLMVLQSALKQNCMQHTILQSLISCLKGCGPALGTDQNSLSNPNSCPRSSYVLKENLCLLGPLASASGEATPLLHKRHERIY